MPRFVIAADGVPELELTIAPVITRQSLAEAFTELREPVSRYLLALGLAVPEAEEVVQETFLRLCQHLDANGSQVNLRGWVFRVAHNLARDEYRRRQRRPTEQLDVEEAGGDTPEQQLLAKERTKRLEAALAQLPEHQQQCLHLRAEGLRYREIAEVLNAGVSTVADWIQRALKTLAKECE